MRFYELPHKCLETEIIYIFISQSHFCSFFVSISIWKEMRFIYILILFLLRSFHIVQSKFLMSFSSFSIFYYFKLSVFMLCNEHETWHRIAMQLRTFQFLFTHELYIYKIFFLFTCNLSHIPYLYKSINVCVAVLLECFFFESSHWLSFCSLTFSTQCNWLCIYTILFNVFVWILTSAEVTSLTTFDNIQQRWNGKKIIPFFLSFYFIKPSRHGIIIEW